MKIIIETIPHNQHRYTTVGDWFYDKDGSLIIRVSKLSDRRYEYLIAIHELIEVLSCELKGITQKEVDAFDIAFEADRPPTDHREPGDVTEAPYRKQHCLATGVERILASIWGVDWAKYERELCELPDIKPKA